MNWKDIGRALATGIEAAPLDLFRIRTQLERSAGLSKERTEKENVALAALADVKKRKNERPYDTELRFLIKASAKLTDDRLAESVHALLGTKQAKSKGKARATPLSYLRPLGGRLADGAQWYVLHVPLGLGAVLRQVNYDLDHLKALADQLAQLPGVLTAEADLPALNMVRPLQEMLPGCTAGRAAAPADVDWAPRLVRYFDLPSPVPDGRDVRIGHIDSGYTAHPELNPAEGYDLVSSASFIDTGHGLDPMPGGASHGTATGSIFSSLPGTQCINDQGVVTEGVTGLVNGAKVVAVRVLDGVIQMDLFLPTTIADGIWHCINTGCHVISISFGGFMSEAVKDAIQAAYEANIIICAAAGNCVRFVVEPAALPGVVACGGVGIDAQGAPHPWPGTSRGPQVAVSAPSENVWIADYEQGERIIRPGEGTSFASPHVASGAAMWLQHHGRSALLNRYAGTDRKLGDVYREVVRSSAFVPQGWDTAQFGAGILDLVQLLNEALPSSTEIEQPLPSMEFLDLIPFQSESTRVRIDFDHITVRDDGEFWGGSEPYLMCAFFEIDGDSATIDCTINLDDLLAGRSPLRATMKPLGDRDSFVRVVKQGEPGEIDEVNIGPVELAWSGPVTIDIPNNVGRKNFTVKPIPVRISIEGEVADGVSLDVGLTIDRALPGFAGVHALLCEEDFTPRRAMLAARDAVAKGVQGILEDTLSRITLNDLSVDESAFVERMAEIEDEAQEAARRAMNPWEAFWGGVVDPDDQLLQIFKFVNVLQLDEPVPMEKRYKGSHGDFILVGDISLRD